MSDGQIWVFQGEGARFASAVFSKRALAEQWIAEKALSGVLTAYPLDTSVYDWAIRKGFFTPKKPIGPEFIGSFSSAHQEHYHYSRGVSENADTSATESIQNR